jgi:glycolate oxidase
MKIDANFFIKAQSFFGAKSVLKERSALVAYDSDALGFHHYPCDCVLLPRNREEVIQSVNLCLEYQLPFVVRGAGTSLSGGPVAAEGGVIIHVSRLNKINNIDFENMTCEVEPGVILNQLNKELSAHALFYPPDPSSGSVCTIGGNVAENAGGLRCFKYGMTTNYVLGAEVLLLDGRVVTLGGPAGETYGGNNCDWKSLFVGSEGMLGIFLKIWLRVKPLPEKYWTFLITFKELQDAADTIVDLVRSSITPLAIELIDKNVIKLIEASPVAAGFDVNCWALITEIDGPASLVDCQAPKIKAILERHSPKEIILTDSPSERAKLWLARKSAAGLMGQISPDIMTQDAVIPRSKIGEVLSLLYAESEKAQIHCLNVFHAGDGNLHPNFLFDSRIPDEEKKVKELGKVLMNKTIECGGALSGEHGIGNDKMAYIPSYFGASEIKLQEELINCFNPMNQLNPGKVFPQRSFVGCCRKDI